MISIHHLRSACISLRCSISEMLHYPSEWLGDTYHRFDESCEWRGKVVCHLLAPFVNGAAAVLCPVAALMDLLFQGFYRSLSASARALRRPCHECEFREKMHGEGARIGIVLIAYDLAAIFHPGIFTGEP